MESRLNATEYVEARHDNRAAPEESRSSGVSWGAVIGGAFVVAAFYLIMLALGAGFGLSAVSPWASFGVSASAFGAAAIIWLILSEVIASALGGYLTGRLRTKWSLIHNDEVFFRDTANGFLAWAVALVVSAAFLTSAAASMAGNVAEARGTEGVSSANSVLDPNAYYADALFRSDRQEPVSKDPSAQAEAGRILRQRPSPYRDVKRRSKLLGAGCLRQNGHHPDRRRTARVGCGGGCPASRRCGTQDHGALPAVVILLSLNGRLQRQLCGNDRRQAARSRRGCVVAII